MTWPTQSWEELELCCVAVFWGLFPASESCHQSVRGAITGLSVFHAESAWTLPYQACELAVEPCRSLLCSWSFLRLLWSVPVFMATVLIVWGTSVC